MTLDDLSVNFSHLDRTALLHDWQWLIGVSRLPIMVTAVGDAFVEDTQSGEVYFLDTVEGQLKVAAADANEFRTLLADNDFVEDRFSVSLVAPLLKAGARLGPGQVFSFKKPPVLGGEYSSDNLEAADVGVHFSLTGQIWSQVKDLPDGTPIDRVTIS